MGGGAFWASKPALPRPSQEQNYDSHQQQLGGLIISLPLFGGRKKTDFPSLNDSCHHRKFPLHFDEVSYYHESLCLFQSLV